MRTAISSAHSLASRLMERVARAAARSCAPTWSTPGRPCRICRSAASEPTTPAPVIPAARCRRVPGARHPGRDDAGRSRHDVGVHSRPAPAPGIQTTESLAARAVANPGLISVLMIRSRSSKCPNALFIALIVSHSMSDQP